MTGVCAQEVHEAIKADPAKWSALPLRGHMPTEDDAGNPLVLELRNCSCHSTLAIEVAP